MLDDPHKNTQGNGVRSPKMHAHDKYIIKIGNENLVFERYHTDDPLMTGRQLLSLAKVKPVDEHIIFMVLNGGGFEELRLEEAVDLRNNGVEKFIVFESSVSFRIVVDGERFEWGAKFITGLKLKQIANIDSTTNWLWQEVRGDQDIQIDDEELINIARDGLERFFTQKIIITIIVNGREKVVNKSKISFSELIRLAFENPPTGDEVCFTATFRRGCNDRPEGSLIEGQSVKVTEGMIFNVTATDKS